MERETVEELLDIGAVDIANLESVLVLDWLQDGITDNEHNAIGRLQAINRYYSKETTAKIIGLSWVQDGVTEAEYDTIYRIRWLADQDKRLAAAVVAMLWARDDITETEADVIEWLYWLADEDERLAAAVVAMPWTQDDITETEADAIKYLHRIAYNGTESVFSIVTMPFLESLERDDLLALYGMSRLESRGILSALLDHSTLRDGITNAYTPLVVAASLMRDAGEIGRLLDPGYATIESASGGTELTPHVKISIVRAGTQPQAWTVEHIKDAVKFTERTMQVPLPVDHVILVLVDEAVPAHAKGANHGIAISYETKYEQGQDTFGRYLFQSSLLHEVAHYYWRGNEAWINEGLAKTIEYMRGVEREISPEFLQQRSRGRGDCEAHNLEMLTEWDPESGSPQFSCNYYLGQLLFKELLGTLGAGEFGKKVGELYLLSLDARNAGETPGIDQVRQAFLDQSEIVEKHWSGNLNAPENRTD